MTVRLAMWSGPRNISTAMMRSWENRPDCEVVDEPFYACYLKHSGVVHPMQDEILASQPTDWQAVADSLTVDLDGYDLFYQKHMTHHMLDGVSLDWCRELKHCFLIRNPADVIHSYLQKRDEINSDDIGIQRQHALYHQITTLTGQEIPIIDSRDVLMNPDGLLRAVCERLDLPFSSRMLRWPAGRRDSDGIWASHWYHAVEASTGFMPWREHETLADDSAQALAEENMPYYQRLHDRRLRID